MSNNTFGPVATSPPTKYELLIAARQAAYRQFIRAIGAKSQEAAASAWEWVTAIDRDIEDYEAMALGAWAIAKEAKE